MSLVRQIIQDVKGVLRDSRRAAAQAAPDPGIERFITERRQVMNAEMERKGLELPDPADLLPADWRTLPDAYKRALYCEAWADLGANIAYLNDRAKMPEWEQPTLPLVEFMDVYVCRAGGNWCAPSEPGYSVT